MYYPLHYSLYYLYYYFRYYSSTTIPIILCNSCLVLSARLTRHALTRCQLRARSVLILFIIIIYNIYNIIFKESNKKTRKIQKQDIIINTKSQIFGSCLYFNSQKIPPFDFAFCVYPALYPPHTNQQRCWTMTKQEQLNSAVSMLRPLYGVSRAAFAA